MDKNREFARLVGLCWHEYDTETLNCIHCEKVMWRKDSNNPDYAADPRLVLKEMAKRPDWDDFQKQVIDPFAYISDTTGKPVKLAIKYLDK